MLQGIIIRGTTPEHKFDIPYPQELIKDIRVTYGQRGSSLFTKTLKECTLGDEELKVPLTQEDTFKFVANRPVHIEIRILFTDGNVVRTEDPIRLRVIDTMDTEVMQ